MNRKERRAQEKAARKNKKAKTATSEAKSKESPEEMLLKTLQDSIHKLDKNAQNIANFVQNLDKKFSLLVDTLERKEILTWNDLQESQSILNKKLEERDLHVKKILEKNLSFMELLNLHKEDKQKSKFESLGLNLVEDLNVNPQQLITFLKQNFPKASKEEIVEIGKRVYELKDFHFQMSK